MLQGVLNGFESIVTTVSWAGVLCVALLVSVFAGKILKLLSTKAAAVRFGRIDVDALIVISGGSLTCECLRTASTLEPLEILVFSLGMSFHRRPATEVCSASIPARMSFILMNGIDVPFQATLGSISLATVRTLERLKS